MNEEEKKAIEILADEMIEYSNIAENVLEGKGETAKDCRKYVKAINTILNLIEKQQKEIEKKDKIINEMAKYIDDTQMEVGKYYKNKQEVIEYFTKKVEENK